jgi:hypothetical protein
VSTPQTAPTASELGATTIPFSLSLLTVTKGNASKRLVPDTTHNLSMAAGRIERVQAPRLTGFGDLLQRSTQQPTLVRGEVAG